MSNFNKVILMGRLTRDPEIRYSQSQTAVCKAGVVVNERYKDAASGDWKERATFVDVTIFGKRAEAFEKYHRKGAQVFFEGRLAFDTWDDKNSGQKRSKLYVIAESWEFVGGGQQQQQTAASSSSYGGGGGGYTTSKKSEFDAAAGASDDWLSGDDTPF